MKKFLTFILVLCVAPMASASIAYVGGAIATGCTNGGGVSGAGTCSPTYSTATAGNEIVMFYRAASNAQTSYAQDNNWNTLFQGQQAFYTTAYGYVLSSFAGTVQSGATAYTVTGMGGTTGVVMLGEYSGVLSVNLNPTVTCPNGTVTNNRCTGSTATVVVGVTLDDANDVPVCAITQQLPNGSATYSSFVGNEREYNSSTSTAVMLDNTSGGSAGTTLTVGATQSTANAWVSTCIELRTISQTASPIGQISPSGYSSLAGPSSCLAQGGSWYCTWPVKTTTAGSSYVIHYSGHSDQNDAPNYIAKVTTCSALTNGICDGIHNVVDTPYIPGGNCRASVHDAQPESDSSDNAIMVNGQGGVNYVTTIRTGADPTNTERQILTLVEAIPTSGNLYTFDTCASNAFTSDASSFTIPSFSTIGSNEFIVMGWTGGVYAQAQAANSAYSQGESIPNHMGIWVATGQSTGTGATITASAGSNGGVETAVAFQLQAISASNSVKAQGVVLSGDIN